MITRTFIKKSNTIIENTNNNFGLNPICSLHYGTTISRFLLYFDIENIKKEYDNGNFNSDNKVTHTLRMTNCGSIDDRRFKDTIPDFCGSGIRKRASSFEIIAFEIPSNWDAGVGFDSSMDFWLIGDSAISNDGSNWEFAYNGKEWDENGIYSNEYLNSEYVKFANGEKSIIISRQKFDYGNEDINLDITTYINDVINGEKENNGICISFSPYTELLKSDATRYVGFFNNNTNTFFAPYIESRCNKQLIDNRFNFTNGKENKLLFICNLGDNLTNLDEIPTCTINGIEYPVKQAKKGVYEATISADETFEKDSILYDVWSNIKYNGKVLNDVEMEFVVNGDENYFSLGKFKHNEKTFSPLLIGINGMEKINMGEIRTVKIYFKEEYTNNSYELLDKAEYRIYVLDGKREIDVINDYIDQIEDFNLFQINTGQLLPQNYHVDIKITYNNEVRCFKNCLEFEVVNNVTKYNR